jgi:steroid 5-alpha reductase family enzyme
MTHLSLLIYWWLAMMLVMVGLWAYQLKHKDGGIADVGWAYGLGGAAIYFAISDSGDESRRLLLAIFAGIWGVRLGTYLLIDRVIKAKAEDGRYQAMRKAFGEKTPMRFFIFFQGQALFIAIFAIPFLVVSMNSRTLFVMWDFMAISIWIVSNAFVWVADKQLARFRMDPANKGEVCQVGLWRYSRHPNYFFEWLHWWSYVFLAIGSQYFLASFIGPVVMLILLLKVTGIPYTELQALRSRGEKYRAYQNTTSPFFPWFPKESV